MASKSDIEAGKAFVRLFVKDETTAALQKVGENLRSFGKGVAGIGVAMTAASSAVVAFGLTAVNQFSSVGDAVAKMAGRTGLTTEAVSELGHAADLSGTSIETVERGLRKMQDTLVTASSGMNESTKAINKLGLSTEKMLVLSPEKQLEAFADAISSIENPAERTAAAIDIFGKSGTELLPMFSGGSKGIAEMREQAKALGLSMSGEMAKSAEEVNDAMGTLRSSLGAVVTQIGAALAPVITQLANRLFPIIGRIATWIRNNQSLVVSIAAATVAIGAIGAGLTALGLTAAAIGTALAGLGAIASVVFSPITVAVMAVVSAIGLAIAVVYRLSNGFRDLIGPLSRVFALMNDFGRVVASGGMGALLETLSRAGPLLRSFMNDIFSQLPTLAGYWLGRATREIVMAFHNITTAIINRIIESIGDLIKAAVSGDFGGALDILMSPFRAAGGFGAGLTGGAAPAAFTTSAETQREFEQFKAEIESRNLLRQQLKEQQNTNRLLQEQRLAFR